MPEQVLDRRQRKTRVAVLEAFSRLLAEEPYDKITIQEIIDRANIGRSTFYSHFATKDDLLRTLCGGLFDHIITSALDRTHTHGLCSDGERPVSIFLHILAHLRENDSNILSLLSGESNDLFLRDFRNGIKEVVRTELPGEAREAGDIPREFLVNHIAGSFIEMVRWWLENGMRQTPEELDGYFQAVSSPLLQRGR
ncbi:MAG: TetR/AcrR family transcriptional regulator [Fretibacterium sp.]|uniref:TetR/AcrR family transcriptional regulator n=1 Tax=Fretibacterium sp. OH1220_COT-178 TaxID=2491047 RepID=UPI001F26BED1|nr:TetR/AcrR family transcriptional regulator [Fretibacterium sp. OH1220_COT-178]MDO4787126.1 TetR/AcrR family transcriptional regulator [Fretibacterium sp.]